MLCENAQVKFSWLRWSSVNCWAWVSNCSASVLERHRPEGQEPGLKPPSCVMGISSHSQACGANCSKWLPVKSLCYSPLYFSFPLSRTSGSHQAKSFNRERARERHVLWRHQGSNSLCWSHPVYNRTGEMQVSINTTRYKDLSPGLRRGMGRGAKGCCWALSELNRIDLNKNSDSLFSSRKTVKWKPHAILCQSRI